MARGEIMIAARDGHSVPYGAGIDSNGRDTTDPKAILDGGAQLAFGGYKGAALAMMVELLVGALIGDKLSFEAEVADNGDGGPPAGGELIIALDPARFGDGAGFAAHADLLFERMLSDDGVRLPGDRRRKARLKTAKEGIRVPQSLFRTLTELVGP